MNKPRSRCINLDWFELYCLEINGPRDAEYFRNAGLWVKERGYGTKVYAEMFTIMGTDNYPLLEVRRKPLSDILPSGSCHIRLVNRICYFSDAVDRLLSFLHEHAIEWQRVSRADICLDFEYFDRGDDPADFLHRYMKGVYTKVNQANITGHGKDTWKRRDWNSVSWGSASSPISTKMYDKTLELKEVSDKPYIRQAWFLSGLIDNPVNMTKIGQDGEPYKPRIWRVEFSIKSSVKKWVTIELDGEAKKYYSLHNTPAMYNSKEKLFALFASLTQHYFHFKIYMHGFTKYQCRNKVLFNFDTQNVFYKVEKVSAPAPTKADNLKSLVAKLNDFKLHHSDKELRNAIDIIVQAIENESIATLASSQFSKAEIIALRTAISLRKEKPEFYGTQAYIEYIKQLIDENNIF